MICLKSMLTGRLSTTGYSYLQPVTECRCHKSLCRNHNSALSYSCLDTGFSTRLIRQVPLMEQDANSIHFAHTHTCKRTLTFLAEYRHLNESDGARLVI